MLHNYKSFTLILESKNREKKIEKQKNKIRKFLRFEPIIDYVMDRVVSNDSTKGLQYTVWFADKIKNDFLLGCNQKIEYENNLEIFKNKKHNDIFKTLKEFLKNPNKNNDLKNFLNEMWDKYINGSGRTSLNNTMTSIIDWLKSPIRDEEVNLNQYKTLEQAYQKSEEWHKNIKATGVIIKEKGTVLLTFDDGWYWIDLETDSCNDEANAMGHCGTTDFGDTLYSLRRKQSPHVTAAIGTSDGIVYQMKGRNNKKPKEKYHKYIVELMKYPNVGESVTIQNKFEPISIFSTNEYNSQEDFHLTDLNVDQIKEINKSNSNLIENANIGVKYKLYENGVITAEDFIKNYNDLKIINNEIHFIINNFGAFDCGIFAENMNYKTGWQCEVLSGEYMLSYDNLKFNYDYEWDKVDEIALKEIMNKCIEKKYEIDYEDQSQTFTLSKENMKLSPNKDDIWINSPIGGVLSIKKLLSKNISSVSINTSNGHINFHTDDLDDIKHELDVAYTQSQQIADEGEAYELVTDSIINQIGDIIKSPEGKYWKDGTHIKLDWNWVSELNDALPDSDQYNSIIDMINDIPNINYNYNNDFLIDCDPPYYGWQGLIDKEILSEEIINRLYNV